MFTVFQILEQVRNCAIGKKTYSLRLNKQNTITCKILITLNF